MSQVFQPNHKDIIPYNKIIRYKTYEVAICKMLSKESLPRDFYQFYDIIVKIFLKNYEKIKCRIWRILLVDVIIKGI